MTRASTILTCLLILLASWVPVKGKEDHASEPIEMTGKGDYDSQKKKQNKKKEIPPEWIPEIMENMELLESLEMFENMELYDDGGLFSPHGF